MRTTTLLLCSLPLFLSACVSPPKYNWGAYDQSLYNYYRDAGRSAEYMAEVERMVNAAEQNRAKPAPGIHAEYGYLLMQAGRNDAARVQFEKEKASWPESTQLMNNMIRLAGAQNPGQDNKRKE
jgi:hypothetical protein